VWRRVLVAVVITAAIVFGAVLVVLAATLGSCSAFGGRCPADRPALVDDDVFGMAASGAFLIVAVPVFLSRPSWRRLAVAAGVGIGAALLIGLLVRALAYG
jgi:hypothetical protein